MGEFIASEATQAQLERYNSTLYRMQLNDKSFIFEIAVNGTHIVEYIFSNGQDLDFASALIQSGVTFSPMLLVHGAEHYSEETQRSFVSSIATKVRTHDSKIMHDVLDTVYVNNPDNSNKASCFYPPRILANATQINHSEHNMSVLQMYESLYNSNITAVRDTVQAAAIFVLNSAPKFFAPVTASSAIQYAACSNSRSGVLDTCFLPLNNFSHYEAARVLHELTHFVMDGLFHNSANPYLPLNEAQQASYSLAAKKLVANTAALANLQFKEEEVINANLTLLHLTEALLRNKDLLLYTVPLRQNDSTRINLLSKYFFEIAIKESAQIQFMQALYEAEIASKNISHTDEVYLERIGDLITYPPTELDSEVIARYVELCFNNFADKNNTMFLKMSDYWTDVISPLISDLRETIEMVDCDNTISGNTNTSVENFEIIASREAPS